MNEKLEKIKKYMGDEAFTRALEVLNIIGFSIPEDFDLYAMNILALGPKLDINEFPYSKVIVPRYGIILSDVKEDLEGSTQAKLDEVGVLDFSEGGMKIYAIKDNVLYHWQRSGSGVYSFEIIQAYAENRGNFLHQLSFSLSQFTNGLKTSELNTHGNGSGPMFISHIETVAFDDKITQLKDADKIENYYDLVNRTLKADAYKPLIPEGLKDPIVLDKLIRILETPIREIAYASKNYDQSWRYEEQANQIRSGFDLNKDNAEKACEQAIKLAEEVRDAQIRCLERQRDNDLYQLEARKKEYLASRERNAMLTLQQKDVPNE